MTKVLVTGVGGGGNGEQLVKSLRLSKTPYRVVGTDLTLEAAQQSGADICRALPRASDPGYIDALLETCAQERVDVLLPGSEPELRLIAEHAAKIRQHVALLAINDQKLIEICSDKFKTAEFLASNGFESPKSWLVSSIAALTSIDNFPLIVKPTVGGGSQNVYLIQSRDELQMICGFLLGYFHSVLVQEYVGRVDQEFTVGVLFDGEGQLINSIALNRFILTSLSNRIRVPNRTARADLGTVLAISSGVSQGRVDDFPEVRDYCERVGLALGAKYAINVQCRLVDGRPMIFEINPRFSGTSSIRAMLGFRTRPSDSKTHPRGKPATAPGVSPWDSFAWPSRDSGFQPMTQHIHLVDLGIGNLGSVTNMLTRAGARVTRTSDPAALADADKVILPGVGSFDAMVQKMDAAGFRQPLHDHVQSGKHLLGICLGMHLLADRSDEGQLSGLGLIPGRVRRFHFEGAHSHLKVPHMGWNHVAIGHEHALGRGLQEGARFYFVHSYYFDCEADDDMLFRTSYGHDFASGVQRSNVMGVQFHPEKSHRFGLQLIRNFVEL